MVCRFVILRRKNGMNVAEFRRYWRDVHGPLIAKIPGVLKYIQYHVHSDSFDKTDASIDGIAQLWFESEETQKAAWDSTEYKAVVEDEVNLFEMNSHSVHPVMVEEVAILKE